MFSYVAFVVSLFVLYPSFGASGGPYFVIAAFSGYLHLYLYYMVSAAQKKIQTLNIVQIIVLFPLG